MRTALYIIVFFEKCSISKASVLILRKGCDVVNALMNSVNGLDCIKQSY